MMAARPRFVIAVFAATFASLVIAGSAFGQWLWKDDAGHLVASDQPPPMSVPQSRIIKEPRKRAPPPPTPAVDADDAPKDPAKADAAKSVADRELDAKQRQKEAADAAKKADDDAAKAKALQENCSVVKGNLAALQAGGRAARFNEKGERYYLDDAQRANEITRAQGQISQNCK